MFKIRNSLKYIAFLPVIILGPIILFPLLVYTYGQINRCQIRNEIFSYVQENSQYIQLDNPASYQDFFYTATGLQDGGVEYGYYFSPNDTHTLQGDPYRKGYRTYGIPDDDTDWYYTERICKNWFYYEIHDG